MKKEWKLLKKYATLLENAERKVYKYTMDEKELANLRKQAEAIRFSAYNHIELALAEPDHAVFRLNIRPESKNSYNIVHGGALYTMADNASGFAAHSDGRSYVTQSGSLHFIRNRSEGEIRAEARVRHRGRALYPWTSATNRASCWPPGNLPSSASARPPETGKPPAGKPAVLCGGRAQKQERRPAEPGRLL